MGLRGSLPPSQLTSLRPVQRPAPRRYLWRRALRGRSAQEHAAHRGARRHLRALTRFSGQHPGDGGGMPVALALLAAVGVEPGRSRPPLRPPTDLGPVRSRIPVLSPRCCQHPRSKSAPGGCVRIASDERRSRDVVRPDCVACRFRFGVTAAGQVASCQASVSLPPLCRAGPGRSRQAGQLPPGTVIAMYLIGVGHVAG